MQYEKHRYLSVVIYTTDQGSETLMRNHKFTLDQNYKNRISFFVQMHFFQIIVGKETDFNLRNSIIELFITIFGNINMFFLGTTFTVVLNF